MSVNKLLLLPGMDGTGDLLLDFLRALPSQMQKKIPIYLKDKILSYDDLAKLVRSICEDFEPEVILAESFSTPLAIRIAAEKPKNLKAVILCVGFAASPVRGLVRWLSWVLAPVLMRFPLPESFIRSWLVGADAPTELPVFVRKTIASVQSDVLAARLRAVLACDVGPLLGEINVPLLYLQAQHDRLVRPQCLFEIQRIRPDVQVCVVDGPHFLLQRRPAEVAKIVTDFMTNMIPK
jgi:pimeloyl-ACP methyl ester carboxylesterase